MPSSADELRARLERDRARRSPTESIGGTRRPQPASTTTRRRPSPDPSASTEPLDRLRAMVREAPGTRRTGERAETLAEALPPVGDVRADDARDLGRAAPRAASTLQQMWIDPEETPFEPVVRPGNPLTARLISWTVVLAFLGALGWLVIPELNLRLANLDTLMLRNGVLSAQAVPLEPIRPATVTELYVDAGRLPDGVLPKGTPIARIRGMAEDGRRLEVDEIRVPFDARFVSVDTLVGGVVLPGTPVATVYDPTQMYVIVTVRPDLLDQLRRGMRVQLHSPVLDDAIAGEVISAVPLLGSDHEPTTANLVNVRIKPDPEAIADLVPGIRFDVAVDLSSAPPGAQPLVFTYAGHTGADEEPADGADGPGSDLEPDAGAGNDGG